MTEHIFPNDVLRALVGNLEKKVAPYQSERDRLLMFAGAALNWLGDFLTDESVLWSREDALPLDDLTLTGTGPEWNAVIIDQCGRSPARFRALLREDPKVRALFSEAIFTDEPILARYDEEKLKVLDGMHRVIAAIRDRRFTIRAYVATPTGQPKPHCEAHVVYDLLRAYQRGLNRDRGALVTALRFLRGSYANVDELLRIRFGSKWIPDNGIQEIIAEALKD